MTDIKLDIRKNVEKSAAIYFESSKKMRAKIAGVVETIQRFEKQLFILETQEKSIVDEFKKKFERKLVEKKWFEKFHWFISSEGFLCIGGRDSTSNEVIIKKHVDKDDVVFHTEAAGSPFFVIKSEGKKPGEISIEECAIATICYSKAWKFGLASTDVYWITPQQVSKQTESGEYVGKGAFIIRGKKNNVVAEMKLAIGITKDNKIMGGPVRSVSRNCEKYVLVFQGGDKSSDVAKKVLKILGVGDLNEIIAVLPAGGCRVMRSE